MTKEQLEQFKEKLLAEKTKLEAELSTIGRRTGTPGDWEPIIDEADASATDPNDRADAMEDLEENASILNELEARLAEVTAALARIDAGTYGLCVIGGEPIPPARLAANPAAKNCIAHGDNS